VGFSELIGKAPIRKNGSAGGDPDPPGVFLCYRREDSSGYAGRLHDYVKARFPDRPIFIDIDTIRPGEDFHLRIEKAIDSSSVVVALIGPRWEGPTPGGRRIDDVDDFVRIELARALATGRPVIPVLVHGAHMLTSKELPEPLRPLGRRNAIALRDTSWKSDVGILLDEMDRLLGAAQEAPDSDADRPDQPNAAAKAIVSKPATTNLPSPANPLLGREAEVIAITELLAGPDVRLVTLTGPGGIGKTRLALEVAVQMQHRFPDGIWWVPLQAVRDSTLVLQTVAQVMDAREEPAAHIADSQTLLVLDNLEQVISAGPHIAELLRACARLTILGTSREPLHLSTEHEYPISSLPDTPAVSLFTERARAVRADFDAAPEAVDICRRLDGLPLAIELVAARVKVLSPGQILERLENRLPLLVGGARDLPERQQTLTGTIAWSYDLLLPADRLLFARLSVFSSGCTLRAAEAVCGADVETISSLLDKSLLRREGDRYLMLETIREYALGQLRASGEAEKAGQLHAEFYAQLADLAEPVLRGPMAQPIASNVSPVGATLEQWLERFAAEHDNVRAALAWCIERSDHASVVRLFLGASSYWQVRGNYREGRTWTERVLSVEGVDGNPRFGFLLMIAGEFSRLQGDLRRAQTLKEQGLARLRESGEKSEVAFGLHHLGAIFAEQGDYDRARGLLEEGLAIRRELGDAGGISQALNGLSALAFRRHDYADMERFAEEEVQTARAAGDIVGLAGSLHNLGEALRWQGDVAGAARNYVEALRISAQMGNPVFIGECLDAFGDVSAIVGAHTQAAELWAASERLLTEAGAATWDPDDAEARVRASRTALGVEAFDLAWRTGHAMSTEEAVKVAEVTAAEAQMDHPIVETTGPPH
jgi:predicted ATPase